MFAHTMWDFEILRKGGSVAEANRHFAIALQPKRERDYVRHMQISALLRSSGPELECEAIQVANEMRRGGEAMPVGIPERSDTWGLWNVYYSRLIFDYDKPQFLAAISPADHVATFRWLSRRISSRRTSTLYLYILAQLQELNGDRTNALASYQKLRSQLGSARGPLVDHSNAAIKRLSKQ